MCRGFGSKRKACESKVNYILFGAEALGERYYNRLKNDHNIIAFVDNSPEKQGQQLLSLDILPPSQITSIDVGVIITTNRNIRASLIRQIFDMGIKSFYMPTENL